MSAPRDWRELVLEGSGRSLIEASAGTGKTWTISLLYLRLLLEQPSLSPRRIVVTTFTKAAAEELRERLRGRLLWALQQSGADLHATEEPTASDSAWLWQRWHQDSPRREADAARLNLALAELDLAPIGTLHSLCRRILADHPFASGAPFVSGDLADGSAVLAEVTRDLWRVHQQSDGQDDLASGTSEQVRGSAGHGWPARETIAQAIDFAKSSPDLCRTRRGLTSPGWTCSDLPLLIGQLDPKLDLKGLQNLVGKVLVPGVGIAEAAVEAAETPLPSDCAARLEYYAATPGALTAKTTLRRGWAALAVWLRDQTQPVPDKLLADLEPAGKPRTVLKAAQGDAELQALMRFTVEDCIPHIECRVAATPKVPPLALRALAAAARERLQQRLAAANQLRFDDLLQTVHDVLADPDRGAALADALFAAWPVALVDEFQDTDGQQYGILDRIYRDADGGPRGRLVMIGDPKQAIYRFRGGDIHAYLRAAASAGESDRLRLAVNQRSSRALVASCNAFYALCGETLGSREDEAAIVYHPVEASGRQDGRPYCIDDEPVSRPLCIHTPDALPSTVDERRELALHACADHIASLLASGRHRIGDAPLKPSDIAVLLPKNRQLDTLRDLLRERGVPCVTSSRASVFESDSARELQVILHAVAHTDDLPALRAALATRLWGMDYAGLRALGDDPAGWQPIIDGFRSWQLRWRTRGVQSVVDALIERVAPGCLARADGERVLTDLRHLGELLQEQGEYCTGPVELLAWLAEQREGGGSDDEDASDARQLRIESDATRVRLMSLHLSKGLEFPIVFLPLMWDHKGMKSKGICLLTDPGSGQRRIESTPTSWERDLQEQQDECFRVLYVALTRAIHACHVYAIPAAADAASGAAQSALQAMLTRRREDDAANAARIEWRDGWPLAPGARYRDPQAEAAAPRRARELPTAAPGPLPARHSFTTLTRFAAATQIDPEAAAGDEQAIDAIELAAPVEAPPHPQLLALSSARGPDFGNAVHAIFERRVPGRAMAEQRDLIRQQLALFNVGSRELDRTQLVDRLAERLQAVLDATLDEAAGLRLGALRGEDLRAEMGFHFVLQGASMRRLQAICRQPDGSSLVPSDSRVLAGLMTGKIDLCFLHDGRVHLLDYKGNHLGDSLVDYQGDSLRAKMDGEHYRFQALIYTVALDRYLRQRIPGYRRDRHLGDCWYLFVRAVGLEPGAGIWRHRFPDDLLDAVDAELASGLPQEAA